MQKTSWPLLRGMSGCVVGAYRFLCFAGLGLSLGMTAAETARGGYQMPPVTVPAGFTVELAAAPPLVGFPMMACFDERGRLFIAESAGFNLDEKQLAERRPNFIRMLEDTDGDGRFDRSTLFADRLMIPNGVLWHQGALYVAEPPGIWRYTDADGDGVADKREHIAGNVRSNGMSSTLHGPTLHPSGRLFWCSGQSGYSLDKDREPPLGRIAPGVFSLKTDGSEHEVFAIGGMANPVEVTFNDEGEIFGTIAILGRWDGQRNDSLMHWIYGGVYPHNKNDPVPVKRTGPDLPALSRVGQVAPAGLEYYRSATFGAEFRGNIFWSQFNTHRVVRTRIQRDGATFRAQDEDFLVSDYVDFHPTDVLEDADGSLLVIDTGGWFRHGCPTSHIAKPDARGAIYRVRRKDAPAIADPRGLKLKWDRVAPGELITRLGDPRAAVQDRTIATLAQQGDAAVESLRPLLQSSRPVMARRNAVWTLARIDTPAARTGIRDATRDAEATVRQAAVNALGWARDQSAVARISELLEDPQAAIRREAATALGRIKDERAVGALLRALRTAGDAFLQHSLIYALIQIERPEATVAGLADEHAGVRRGALLALGQMDKVALTPEQIAPLLRAEDVELQRAAFSVAARLPALRDELKAALRTQLGAPPAAARAELIRDTLSGLAGETTIQSFVVELLDRKESHPQV